MQVETRVIRLSVDEQRREAHDAVAVQARRAEIVARNRSAKYADLYEQLQAVAQVVEESVRALQRGAAADAAAWNLLQVAGYLRSLSR